MRCPMFLSLLTPLVACGGETPANDAVAADLAVLTERVTALQATVDAQAATIDDLRTQLALNDANDEARDATFQAGIDADAAADEAVTASVAALAADLDALRTDIATQTDTLDRLEATVSLLDITGISDLLGVASVNADGDLVVQGANLYVQSGTGSTNGAVNGKGNLILGYDENNGLNTKSGSHNLILGRDHTYTSYAGIVAGYNSTATGAYASVLGGIYNVAGGDYAVAAGGRSNAARGTSSSVSGGWDNESSGSNSSILGGYQNSTSGGTNGTVCGGWDNSATGSNAAILGGHENVASAGSSTVYGGRAQTAASSYAYAP